MNTGAHTRGRKGRDRLGRDWRWRVRRMRARLWHALAKERTLPLGPVQRIFTMTAVGLFLIIGMGTTAAMILLPMEAHGLLSVLVLGGELAQTMASANGPEVSSYTGHILTVIIITLTIAGLFISVLSIAGAFGLKTSVSQIGRDVRDEVSRSVHKTVEQMALISHEGVRAQTASDRSVSEWRTHHAWRDQPDERRRALLRAYKNIEFAGREIDLALERLDRSSAPGWVRNEKRPGLERLRQNILNNRAFYLAELCAYGCLADDSALVRDRVVPSFNDAFQIAAEGVEEVLNEVRRLPEPDPVREVHVHESALYVRYQMDAAYDPGDLADELRDLVDTVDELIEDGHAGMEEFRDTLYRRYSGLLPEQGGA